MRPRLLLALRNAFPHTKIYTINDNIVLITGWIKTIFTPVEGFWEQPYTEAVAREVIEQIQNIREYQVDTKYDKEMNKEESRGI